MFMLVDAKSCYNTDSEEWEIARNTPIGPIEIEDDSDAGIVRALVDSGHFLPGCEDRIEIDRASDLDCIQIGEMCSPGGQYPEGRIVHYTLVPQPKAGGRS